MTDQPRRLKPFQRIYADEAAPLVQAIQGHRTALMEAETSGDKEEQLAALGPMGEAYRMLGQLEAALGPSERALALARELNKPKFVLTNLIRLATTYQYMNRHADAEPLFEEALALAQKLGMMEDYVCQHHGKSLAEQGRWDEAIAHFERALELRRERGNAALVDSTLTALDEARSRRPRAE